MEDVTAGNSSTSDDLPDLIDNSSCESVAVVREVDSDSSSDCDSEPDPPPPPPAASPSAGRVRLLLGVWRNTSPAERLLVMAGLWVLLCVICITAVARGGRMGSHPKRLAPRAPQPFFPPSSPVLDYYEGDLADASSLLRRAEVVVLFYYAPWSLDSQHMRDQFDLMARHFPKDQVLFAAVNCWQPGGVCKMNIKVFSFPVVQAFVRHGRNSLTYHGLPSADYLYRFVASLVSPVQLVNDAQQLLEFSALHDHTAVVYVNTNSTRFDVVSSAVFWTAVRTLQHDATGYHIGVAVTGNAELARQWQPELDTDAVDGLARRHDLLTGRTDLLVLNASSTNADELLLWLLDEGRPSTMHWSPTGVNKRDKNEQLGQLFEDAPALLYFTPRTILHDQQLDSYALLRHINLIYRSCQVPNSAELEHAIGRLEAAHAKQTERRRLVAHICELYETRRRHMMQCCNELLASDSVVVAAVHSAASNVCRVCEHDSPAAAAPAAQLPFERFCNTWQADKICGSACAVLNPVGWTSTADVLSKCCHSDVMHSQFWWALLMPNSDVQSHECVTEELAAQVYAANPLAPRHFRLSADVREQLAGVGCGNGTRQLHRFVVADSTHYRFLAHKVTGIDIDETSHLAVIVDASNSSDTVFVLNDWPLHNSTTDALAHFVLNWTHNTLTPWRRSAARPQQQKVENDDADRLSLVRLNAHNFDQYVLAANGDDVVVVHIGGRWCGQCFIWLNVLHTLSLLLAHVPRLRLAVLDADANDVAWQHTVDRYPSLLLYSAATLVIPALCQAYYTCGCSKPDSVAYPSHVPFTVPNVLSFVLAHSQPRVRWHALLSACDAGCLANNTARMHRLHADIQHRLAVNRLQLANSMEQPAALRALLYRQRAQLLLTGRVNAAVSQLLYSLRRQQEPDATVDDTQTALFLHWMLTQQVAVPSTVH